MQQFTIKLTERLTFAWESGSFNFWVVPGVAGETIENYNEDVHIFYEN